MGSIILEGIAVSTAAKVVEAGLTGSYSHIQGKVASSKNLEENYKLLRHDVQSLLAKKDDNEKEVRRQKQKQITSSYSVWLSKISETIAEVEKLLVKNESKKLPRWRFQRRSRLSEEMARKRSKVWELIKEGEFPTGFLVNKLAEPVIEMQDVPQIKGFPTLQSSLEKILVLLKTNNIRAIGVCGMVGVGKTTILQNLNNNEEVAKLFDTIIFLRVSAKQSDHKLRDDKIRGELANRLMLDMEGINKHSTVASMIREELKNQRYLLILDEVLDDINLELLGVPNTNDGSKVVLATNFLHVCRLNNVDKTVEVKPLSRKEAWMMFQNIVAGVIDGPDIKPVARLVSSRCACLPLLIKAIASSFKVKNTASSCRDGLEDLKPWPKLDNEGLKEMYSFLKFCFDDLKDEKKQNCFLYGSLYPADSTVYTDYLIECWAAEGFLGDIDDTRRYHNARDKGHAVLEHLTNVSLLEKGERMIYVRMNNCIRQLALHIREEYRESENLKTWRHGKRVSMIDSDVYDLPEKQNCNMLLTLLLQKNSKLMTIPQSFFENMSGLLVLDLYRTKIGELPLSLSNLTSLKGLYLNDCMFLTKLPPQIEALRHLEVLDIRGCKIHFISFYISYLVNLRCLRISYIKCSESQDMESDCEVIAKLQQLEELIIEVDSCEYDHWCNEVAYVIQQVASLENLRILRFCFPGFASLQYFTKKSKSWRDGKFTSFRFFVGCPNSKRPQILECFEYKINRYMKYRKDKLKDNCIISEVLTETDAFELICHKSITKLSDFVGGARFRRIRSWLIESCNKMSTIVDKNFVQQSYNILLDNMMDLDDDMDESDTSNGSILPNLEQLFLKSLLNLKSVFEGPMHPRNLSKLQILEIINCPILERIFINGSIWQLSGLKKLTIQDCYEIEELITEPEGTETECIVLTKLETLVLINLPKLNTVCLNNSLMWPSLEVLKVHGCPELKTLPISKDNATSLRFIRGQQEWWNQFKRANNEDGEWLQSIFAASGTNAMHVEENIRENHTTMRQMIQEIGSSSFNNISSSLSTTQNEPPQEEELLSMASRVKRIKV